jgi:hypothetical protein
MKDPRDRKKLQRRLDLIIAVLLIIFAMQGLSVLVKMVG